MFYFDVYFQVTNLLYLHFVYPAITAPVITLSAGVLNNANNY